MGVTKYKTTSNSNLAVGFALLLAQNRYYSSVKGNFLGILPLLKSTVSRCSQYRTVCVLAQSKLKGFSTLALQSCDLSESRFCVTLPFQGT